MKSKKSKPSKAKKGYHSGGDAAHTQAQYNKMNSEAQQRANAYVATIAGQSNQVKTPKTQTPRQKAIAAAKVRSSSRIAEMRKKYNSLTPAQKANIQNASNARHSPSTLQQRTLGDRSTAREQLQKAVPLPPPPQARRVTGPVFPVPLSPSPQPVRRNPVVRPPRPSPSQRPARAGRRNSRRIT